MSVFWKVPKSSSWKKIFSWNYQRKGILKILKVTVIILAVIIILRYVKLDKLYIDLSDLLIIPVFTILILIVTSVPLLFSDHVVIQKNGISYTYGSNISLNGDNNTLWMDWEDINSIELLEESDYLRLIFIYKREKMSILSPKKKTGIIKLCINKYKDINL